MVHCYHAIFTAYGFWLPNDPRGSWSTFVGSWELFKFGGGATKTDERRNLARDEHDWELRAEVKTHLKRPAVKFSQQHRDSIVRGFSRVCSESGVVIHAGCIGHDHVHVVTARHPAKTVEQVVSILKGRATQQLRAEGLWDVFEEDGTVATPGVKSCWKVFINDAGQVRAAIDYVERHPEKEGLSVEKWECITSLV